jgi:thiol:disulfide interchange protein DsbC
MAHKPLTAAASSLLAALLSTAVMADADADSKTLATIQQTIESRYPGLSIVDVRPAPLPGLYEVFTGTDIVYADKTGDHLIAGHLVETRTRKDLSAEAVDARNAIDFETLPFDRAIPIIKGKGTRRMAIFADPDCPYCQKLEKELESVQDVTAYVFLYPLADLHPKALERSKAIWCSQDRTAAWNGWLVKQIEPQAEACSGDPIAELAALGKSLRITSTPTMFFESGKRVAGAPSASQLETLLTNNAPASKPKASR